jgi:hypothetical protein
MLFLKYIWPIGCNIHENSLWLWSHGSLGSSRIGSKMGIRDDPGPLVPPPAHHARPARHQPQMKDASKHDVTHTQFRGGLWIGQPRNKRRDHIGLCIFVLDRIRGRATLLPYTIHQKHGRLAIGLIQSSFNAGLTPPTSSSQHFFLLRRAKDINIARLESCDAINRRSS